MLKKNILFIIESLGGGGAERVLTTMLKYLDKSKYNVTLCSIVDIGRYVNDVKQFVHYEYILPNPEQQFGLSAYIYKIKYALVYRWLPLKIIYRWFVPHGADVEIAFVEGYATKLLSYSSNKRATKIAWIHIDLEKFHWTKSVYSSLSHESNCYQRYDAIVAVANSVRMAFHRVFPFVHTPVITLYNPIDTSYIIHQSTEHLNLSQSDRFRIISVGRFTKQKAFDRLLHAVSKLKKLNYAVELWLLGDGELRKDLEQIIHGEAIEDSVTLWGFQSNPYKYMSQSDLFVCSSVGEGYSTAVTEALVLGLPVVTTDCSGMSELLNDGECGIITDNSEDALYLGIKRLLDHPDELEYYKIKASEKGLEFNISLLMQSIEHLLDSC